MPRIILILSLIISAQYSFAQEKREFKWQDFMNSVKSTEVAKPVKIGEFTIFQITDINKFLYKVEIAGKVFELQTPIPTELQTLFKLTPAQLEERAASNKVKEASGIIEEDKNKMATVKADVDTDPVVSNKEGVKGLSKPMAKLVKVCEEYYKKSSKLSEDVFSLKSARNKLISIAQSDRSFSAISAMLNEVTIPDPETVKQGYIALQQLYAKVEAAYSDALDKAKEAEKEAETELAEANMATEAADKAKMVQKKITGFSKAIEEASESIEEADKLISDEALLGLLDEVDFLYKELGNKNNFIVVSPPVQMDGDMVSYTVNITPCITRTLGPNKNPMQFKFDIPAKRGLKVDFSVGPAFSFGDNSRDDKYYLAEIPGSPDSVKLTKLDNNNAISPNLAAMMHVYSRGANGFALGGLFGVGVGFQSVQDVNLSVFTGVSLVMGKREKVMVNAGCSWLRIDRIKNKQFEDSKNYASAKITLGDVTEKVFKPSFFIGISYNLTNKVEIK